MKSEKGLTFISTIFLVLIIALFVFGIVYFVRIQAVKEQAQDLKTDMLLVQAKVKTISGEYLLEKKDDLLKGTKLSEMQENSIIQSFLEKDLLDPEEKEKKYYVWDQEILNELDLNQVTLKQDHYYIVEYMDSEVYSTIGYKGEEGNIHYKLSDIEDLKMQNKEIENEQEEVK